VLTDSVWFVAQTGQWLSGSQKKATEEARLPMMSGAT
jgi:hypothetical protein